MDRLFRATWMHLSWLIKHIQAHVLKRTRPPSVVTPTSERIFSQPASTKTPRTDENAYHLLFRYSQYTAPSITKLHNPNKHNAAPPRSTLKLFHQIPPDRPHPRPLPIHVHRNRKEQNRQLYTSEREEDILGPVGLEPGVEEEGEDEAVEDI